MNTEPIKRAAEKLGSHRGLATAAGVTAGMVSQWVNGVRPVAAHHCIRIEQATQGAVTRYELRPDVFGEAPPAAKAA
ncbi:MAG TPA: helix-turn-helix domain-containing protein [Rhodanobacteraceae bacterium]|nr:helix-turn-helix domain-containing protein [Rhodanobacteraceae bacterium]